MHRDLEETDLLLQSKTLVGDNAYVKCKFMSVPFQGRVNGYEDAYNFYLSQLRITIECAFGVLVHRWAILRGPLNMPIKKVGPLLMCLCCLHNFCINKKETFVEKSQLEDGRNIVRSINLDYYSRHPNSHDDPGDIVKIERRCPSSLLGGGHPFNDASSYRHQHRNTRCPMDDMFDSIKEQNLCCPPARGRKELKRKR